MSQRLSKETIQSIQSQVNILDIVGQFVQLRKQGKSLFGRCPFHDERTPSFTVTEEKQLFHCFSCGRGGNVFNFMQELESLSFPESVVRVAELAHIPLDVEIPSSQQAIPQKERKLFAAHEKASEFYSHVLFNTKGGQEALHYLTDRGYTIDTLKEFGFGFSLKDRTQLTQLLQDLELTEQEMEATGLFVESQSGVFDRFNQRIMIPLRNEHGQIVGFSGRVLPGYSDEFASQAKYLNSPETPLFAKRNFLFNFDLAKKNIRKENKVILFEGYMDVIKAHQNGMKNAVALMGTNIDNNKLKEILENNKNSLYGKKYNFNEIKTIEDFQREVPLTTYEDYLAYIEKIKNGEEHILTYEKVKMFELTSGSTSASKLIPYTDSLKKEFQAGIKVWLYSLYKKYPSLKFGKSYWSITPKIDFQHKEKSLIPIGFEEDSEYFGNLEKHLIDSIFVNPKDIKNEKDMDRFYFKTLSALIAEENIRLFSFWSPSLLLLLIEYLEKNSEKILKTLKENI